MAQIMQNGINHKTDVFHQIAKVAAETGWSFGPPSEAIHGKCLLTGWVTGRAVYLVISPEMVPNQTCWPQNLARDVQLIASASEPNNSLLALKLPEVDGVHVSDLIVQEGSERCEDQYIPEIQGEVDEFALYSLRQLTYLPDSIEPTVEVKPRVRLSYCSDACMNLRISIRPSVKEDLEKTYTLAREHLILIDRIENHSLVAIAPSIIYLSDIIHALEKAGVRCCIDIDAPTV